jgi:hypothetical protein
MHVRGMDMLSRGHVLMDMWHPHLTLHTDRVMCIRPLSIRELWWVWVTA